ncbi:glycoside hydrolase family 61 protein [Massarina eburnea CBS 473.64]|uniref:Glycoside hydrolase family 61 protein n=1 Tax=Massarina eburnea CBS 473.64 TaxID=1395130 RepID=A0A6A6RV98_9PLEO|nr:glycoside hydrolase family 61 protein [Massarina eburnea CBS 473.64]
MKSIFVAVATFTATAFGHGFVNNFTTDGTYNQGFLLDYYYLKVNTGSFPDIPAWYAENLDSGFVEPNAYGTDAINCHKSSSPGVLTASVKAGGSLQFAWGPDPWPHGLGPILTYVAACNGDCSKVSKTSLQWVKFHETGIDLSTQTWASQTLINQKGKWTVTVPSLKAGNYVFRHEIIALHGANSANGAQNYPQCFNIAVTGSGTKSLPAGTLGTALYKSNDPGILFNPYQTLSNYTIPGPALWTG